MSHHGWKIFQIYGILDYKSKLTIDISTQAPTSLLPSPAAVRTSPRFYHHHSGDNELEY